MELTVSTQQEDLSSEPSNAKSSRLASIWEELNAQEFSESAAKFITSGIRRQSSAIYDSRWRRFNDWCLQRKYNPVLAFIPIIADFLIFLFEEEKLEAS